MDNDIDLEEFTESTATPFPDIVHTPPYLDVNPDISATFMKEVARVRDEAMAWHDWALLEIQHWRDRCADLEIELMLVQGDFERGRAINLDLTPKEYNKNWRS